jgi:monoamine oxidase
MTVQSREVLVIGAGIAGLTAARDLAIDGYDVAMLEARERIGGRIWTSHELGLPADLGASWIHGFEDNPIERLARRHDIAIVRTNISSVTPARYRSMALYDEDGHRLSSGETAQMSEMMADYLDFVAAKQKEGHEKSMLAVEEAFASCQGYDADQRRRLTFIARTYLEHEWAGPRSDVSLLEHDKSLGFAGHDRVFPEGYAQITDRLAEGTDILLGHEVTQIDYSGARVDVLTNRGSFQSSHVLVTVPLGVLRAGRIAFHPHLPKSKREAIRKTRMGVFNKIFLKFDSVFWDQEDELIGYMGSQDEDWPEIVNFHRIAGLPVLLAFSAGTAGEKNELRTNAELVECLMACLRKMYGQNIPEPVGHLVTRWNQDPFSLGSYSYVPVGSKQSLRRQIGTPVGNRIFFAGEATSQFFPATVHGAFLSGVRAAYEIMLADAKADLMKDSQGEVDTYV